jgi:hypothetical protein
MIEAHAVRVNAAAKNVILIIGFIAIGEVNRKRRE